MVELRLKAAQSDCKASPLSPVSPTPLSLHLNHYEKLIIQKYKQPPNKTQEIRDMEASGLPPVGLFWKINVRESIKVLTEHSSKGRETAESWAAEAEEGRVGGAGGTAAGSGALGPPAPPSYFKSFLPRLHVSNQVPEGKKEMANGKRPKDQPGTSVPCGTNARLASQSHP